MACFTDFFPTAAELAGTGAPADLDGLSLVPALLGRLREQRWHRFLYWEFHERGFSQAVLMEGRWKAVRNRRPDLPLELYDLEVDPGETREVAADHPQVLALIEEYLRTARSDSPDWPIRFARLKKY